SFAASASRFAPATSQTATISQSLCRLRNPESIVPRVPQPIVAIRTRSLAPRTDRDPNATTADACKNVRLVSMENPFENTVRGCAYSTSDRSGVHAGSFVARALDVFRVRPRIRVRRGAAFVAAQFQDAIAQPAQERSIVRDEDHRP